VTDSKSKTSESYMRQHWGAGAAVWRAQTQVLLGRLKCAIYSTGVGRGRVAPCSGHGDGGQLEATRQWVWVWRRRRRGAWAWRLANLALPATKSCLASHWELGRGALGTRRRRGPRRQAVERLGERRRPRAWPGPASARGRPVVFLGGALRAARCAAWPAACSKSPKKKSTSRVKKCTQY
jgi:hypothetical protein